MDDIQVRSIKASLKSAEQSGDVARMLSALAIAMIESVECQANQGKRIKNIEEIVEKHSWAGKLLWGCGCAVGTVVISVIGAYIQAKVGK